jgi:hypothetical protein
MIAMEQIKQLSHKEKLMAIEAIWGKLLASPEPVESPGWHQKALKKRKRV